MSLMPPIWLCSPQEDYYNSLKKKIGIKLPEVHDRLLFDEVCDKIRKYRVGYWINLMTVAGVTGLVMEESIERIMEAYTWDVDYPVNIQYIRRFIERNDAIPWDSARCILDNFSEPRS